VFEHFFDVREGGEMSNPLLSVCLITYNHETYIRQAIEGVLMQQVNFPWEFIIAEDCSPDNTRAILLEYKAKYPELIHLILQEKNVGPGRNFIDLLSAANGKYIAYFEGDDYWTDPLKLQKQVDFLETHPEYSICCHRSQALQADTGIMALLPKQGKTDSDITDLLRYNFILSLTIVFRNYHLKNYINHFWKKQSDYALHLSNAQFGKIRYLDDVMSVYRMHNSSTWSNVSISNRIESVIRDYREIDSDFDHRYSDVIKKAIKYRRKELAFVLFTSGEQRNAQNLWRGIGFKLINLMRRLGIS
jgi:glycosyltransferase involved in cell wall biosynthesis